MKTTQIFSNKYEKIWGKALTRADGVVILQSSKGVVMAAKRVQNIIFDRRRQVDRQLIGLLNAVVEQTPYDDATGIARQCLWEGLRQYIERRGITIHVGCENTPQSVGSRG